MLRSKYWIISILTVLFVISLVMLFEMNELDLKQVTAYTEFGASETGAVNQVTAILFDYRSLDTLGEASVIYAAAVILTIFAPVKQTTMLGVKLSRLVHDGVALILPFIFLFGFYIILFGHISPGGGFTGGVMISSAVIIFTITYSLEDKRYYLLNTERKKMLENLGMSLFILIGLAGLLFGGFFLANAPTGIPLGVQGQFASGGLIPILNLASGIKVGASLSVIFVSLIKET